MHEQDFLETILGRKDQFLQVGSGRGRRPLLCSAAANIVDKAPSQQTGRNFEEMFAVPPIYRTQANEFEKNFVHELRRLQRVIRRFALQQPAGALLQFDVNQIGQRLLRGGVSGG